MMKHLAQRLTLILLAAMTLTATAHELRDLDIVVVLNDLGHARVVERRTFLVGYEGTEAYIKMYNLGNMQVGELDVTDESGLPYISLMEWDTDWSRDMKTGKCGIYHSSRGPELCWGIGNAGERTYEVHYTLTRMVRAYDDYDGFIFRFYEADRPLARHARITISKEQGEFTAADARFWAFGFHGQIRLVDGKIVAATEWPFTAEGESLTVMARFAKGTFHPVTAESGSFRKVQQKAFEGSSYDITLDEAWQGGGKASYLGNSQPLWRELWNELSPLAVVVLFFVWIYELLAVPARVRSEISEMRHVKRLFGQKKREPLEWWREPPFEGNLQRTYGVLKGVDARQADENDRLAAYLMRMMQRKLLQTIVHTDEKGRVTKLLKVLPPLPAPATTAIKHYDDDKLMWHLQQLLWEAAGDDHLLQPDELKHYMMSRPVEQRVACSNLHSSLNDYPAISLSNATRKDVTEVFGLKKFLKEFTLLDERGIGEITLWKDYMVYATLFGIADQVMTDLKRVVPDFERLIGVEDQVNMQSWDFAGEMARASYWGMEFVRNYETLAERSARQARESARSSSGGFGGGVSFGGGGGSFGGGGSGIR